MKRILKPQELECLAMMSYLKHLLKRENSLKTSTTTVEVSANPKNYGVYWGLRSCPNSIDRAIKTVSRKPGITDEKKALVLVQAEELTAMLNFFGIEDKDEHVRRLLASSCTKPPRTATSNLFSRKVMLIFGIWRDQTINMLPIAEVDDESFEIFDKLRMSAINVFIPRQSEAYKHLRKALLKRTDENGKLYKGLLVTDILDEI
uniref:Uncharacterized protein n=1 Tax=Strongyloides venezuelensis TaxID=75913 RepID=A0A0K0FSW7_STRVS